MTSKEALNELFVEANRCSNAPYKYTTYDLLQFCKQIKEDLEMLEILKDNFIAYKDLYHEGKWQLTLKQKKVFVEGSKEYESLKEWPKNETNSK